MIVTEDEAKTKRCQESFGGGFITSDGRNVEDVWSSPSYCIGSACMAWRWAPVASGIPPESYGWCGKADEPICHRGYSFRPEKP